MFVIKVAQSIVMDVEFKYPTDTQLIQLGEIIYKVKVIVAGLHAFYTIVCF